MSIFRFMSASLCEARNCKWSLHETFDAFCKLPNFYTILLGETATSHLDPKAIIIWILGGKWQRVFVQSRSSQSF